MDRGVEAKRFGRVTLRLPRRRCPSRRTTPAIDAVELMNVGVNYVREYMPSDARIQYALFDAGGIAPNVVQATVTDEDIASTFLRFGILVTDSLLCDVIVPLDAVGADMRARPMWAM
jgi:hypothetical protein